MCHVLNYCNAEQQRFLSLFSICSPVRGERTLLRRAAGEPVGAGAEPTPAGSEQGRGGALEAETPHAKEPRLRSVLPLQAPAAPPCPGVREASAHTTGTHSHRDLRYSLRPHPY